MGTAATTVIGVDVSKATLDACLLGPGGASRACGFPNTPAGFAALLARADRHAGGAEAHFGMETAGGYEDALATQLHAAGRVVSVVNPTRIEYAGIVRGRGNKTDKVDARPIAAYTRDHRPEAWSPPSPEVQELQAPVRRRVDLRVPAAQEKGRADGPLLTPAARRSVARVVKLLPKEADGVRAAADVPTAAAPALKADRDLLASIPGIGAQTASAIVAELPALDRVPSAQAAAA